MKNYIQCFLRGYVHQRNDLYSRLTVKITHTGSTTAHWREEKYGSQSSPKHDIHAIMARLIDILETQHAIVQNCYQQNEKSDKEHMMSE